MTCETCFNLFKVKAKVFFQIYKKRLSFLPFKGDFQLFDSVLKVKCAISGTSGTEWKWKNYDIFDLTFYCGSSALKVFLLNKLKYDFFYMFDIRSNKINLELLIHSLQLQNDSFVFIIHFLNKLIN